MNELTADEAHVLLDCVQAARVPSNPWAQYDECADDPKATPGGWRALLASATAKLTKIVEEA